MPEEQNSYPNSQLVFSTLMQISRDVGDMSSSLRGFMSTQQTMRQEIDVIKSDISAVRADVREIKHSGALKAARVAGAITVITALSSAVSVFLVPYLKNIFGI